MNTQCQSNYGSHSDQQQSNKNQLSWANWFAPIINKVKTMKVKAK